MAADRPTGRNPLRILVAEDNFINQKLILILIHKAGFHADIVTSGAEALKALELDPYDMVFMDVQMPEMNGFETTQLIRGPASKVLNHEIPIIAMTAHALAGYREKCLAANMNDYISKPINAAELVEKIKCWAPQKQN
jgi:CheY-like chemotaxis protein